MGVLTAGQAQAFVVNVGGQDWDVTTFTGSYNANTSQFATAANGGVMPWWGDSALANQFATAAAIFGPSFGYKQNSNADIVGWLYAPFPAPGGEFSSGSNPSNSSIWAQATLVTPPPAASVPSPLPALGAAAAFGYSRKLRSRIKGRTNTVGSTYSL